MLNLRLCRLLTAGALAKQGRWATQVVSIWADSRRGRPSKQHRISGYKVGFKLVHKGLDITARG